MGMGGGGSPPQVTTPPPQTVQPNLNLPPELANLQHFLAQASLYQTLANLPYMQQRPLDYFPSAPIPGVQMPGQVGIEPWLQGGGGDQQVGIPRGEMPGQGGPSIPPGEMPGQGGRIDLGQWEPGNQRKPGQQPSPPAGGGQVGIEPWLQRPSPNRPPAGPGQGPAPSTPAGPPHPGQNPYYGHPANPNLMGPWMPFSGLGGFLGGGLGQSNPSGLGNGNGLQDIFRQMMMARMPGGGSGLPQG